MRGFISHGLHIALLIVPASAAGLPALAGCNPFGCSQPGAGDCNPFGCPNPGAGPCTPFGCPPSPVQPVHREMPAVMYMPAPGIMYGAPAGGYGAPGVGYGAPAGGYGNYGGMNYGGGSFDPDAARENKERLEREGGTRSTNAL